MPAPIFHRTDLALALSNRLLHPDTLQIAARDGLFLAGNRQIGKTTFIRHDLIPQLEKENALVIYLDLWDNRERISASEAVLSKVRESLADLSRLSFLKAKPSDVFLQFDAKQVGTPAGVSLAQAFSEIIATYDVNVVLIIDEIQELLRSEAGLNQLASLKAARDAVNLRPNNPNDTYFLLVGIGSQHSLIKSMVIGSSQAFYGSDHLVFPLLSGEYLIWQASQMKDKTKVPSAEALREGMAS